MTASHAESPLPQHGSAPSRTASFACRGLEASWRAKLLPRPEMNAALFEAVARRDLPAGAFGACDAWREPFGILVQGLRDDARLNPLGLSMAHGQIVDALKARIRAQALWRAHPEILDRQVVAPVIILGPMRSGTTRLQRLLACDPRFAHTRMFESLAPIPARGRALKARASLAALKLFNPAVAAIHPMRPNDPEEEFGLFSFSFGSAQFEAQWRVPGFTSWWESADTRMLYREFRSLLQTIAWSRGEPADRPWLLKAPQFMQDLDTVLDVFPDARLICLDRDLDRIVGSASSLVWHQMRIQSDFVDPAWIGREWLRKTLLRKRRAAKARAARPDVPQIDVSYAAIDQDWRAEIRRIYDFLGLELTSDIARRMAAYVTNARSHLGHAYTLEQFGLTRETVLADA